ncbi:MAG TPA: recombinase family protein [Tepidisphaeraceae bacterium]|nr:recombinase family protein [Tepidisphaeraceae bacterium]
MKRAKTLTTKKYIALARVSSKAQEAEGYSLDTQVEALQAYSAKQGGQIVRLWRIAETASKAEQRTSFREMLAYAQKFATDLDGLLVCKVDRAARNLSDYGRLLELESSHGVPLIAVTQPTQDTPAGRMARGSLALMAAFFTDQLSVDVKQGLARRVSDGWFPTVPPYGYRTERISSRSIVCKESGEAANVERIFRLYAYEYQTLDGVVQKLREEGRIYTAKQPHWIRSKVHRILRDRSYIGDAKFHGGWMPGKHPPLVNRVTFDRVQELLGDKIYRPQELTFAGELIACAHCGRRITGEIIVKKTTGKAYKYYRCAGYLAPGHPRIRLRSKPKS